MRVLIDHSDGKVRLGTALKRATALVTDGRDRFEILEDEAAAEMPIITSAPGAPVEGKARFFFRDSGGQIQLCVRFPSGATQILATEP